METNMMIKNINATLKGALVASVTAVYLCCITACSSDPMEPSELQSAEKVQMTLHTSGPQTRADYEGDGGSDMSASSHNKLAFSWRSDDQLSVYVDGVPADRNCKLGTKEKGRKAPFNGEVTPWDDTQKTIYAFYPYSASGYTVSGSENSATATTSFTLPNPQTYTVGGAVSNSLMVGVGQAVTKGNAIDASASLKQVMSIIKLNIKHAPAKVTWVQLKCSEAVFPTTATVKLSDATISNPDKKIGYLAMVVNDGTVGTDKSVSMAMFPADLRDKTITVEVAFEGGKVKSIDKSGLSFERNTHYEMTFDATGAAIPEYYEVNGMKWASGNLVANGAHGAKIGAPTDGGLFFQFGSLIGWSGGANGDGTGRGSSSTYPALAQKVTPKEYNRGSSWNGSWNGAPIVLNPSEGTGDPCQHYLGDSWRLPNKNDFELLFQNSGYPYSGPWRSQGSFSDGSKNSVAVHPSGMLFPAAGYRHPAGGELLNLGNFGCCWSSDKNNNKGGYDLMLNNGNLYPAWNEGYRSYAFNIRCVQK